MASPPYQAKSPPGPSSLALPRQRPTLALPSRKPSLAPSGPGSAHPLRQTSFPPPDSLEAQHQIAEDAQLAQYSPGATSDGIDDISDSEITSAISGPFGEDGSKKRKRGVKKQGGRSAKMRAGSASVANGEEGRKGRTPTAGAPSLVPGEADDEDDDDDDDDAGLGARGDGFTMDAEEFEKDKRLRWLFREGISREHQTRYDTFNRVKLRTQDVRKLVNATLSQSVPAGVVTVVGGFTKTFAGMLVESAREVQAEWMAANPTRPDGGPQPAYKRLSMMSPESESESDDEEEADKPASNSDAEMAKDKHAKSASTSVSSQPNGLPNGTQSTVPNGTQDSSRPSSKRSEKDGKDKEPDPEDFSHVQPGAWGLSKYVEECDRGPLQPDHLREALRRYRKSRGGGNVGFTGISLFGVDGRDIAAPRIGGGARRMFK